MKARRSRERSGMMYVYACVGSGAAMQVGVGRRGRMYVCMRRICRMRNGRANCAGWKVVLGGGCAYQDCGGRA